MAADDKGEGVGTKPSLPLQPTSGPSVSPVTTEIEEKPPAVEAPEFEGDLDLEIESPPQKRRVGRNTGRSGVKRKAKKQTRIQENTEMKFEEFSNAFEAKMNAKLEEIRAMFNSFAENVTKQLDPFNMRVSALESAQTAARQQQQGRGVGPIKSTKPYSRPAAEGLRSALVDTTVANRNSTE